MAKPKTPKPPLPQALAISRNKHWRYISAFHGPWLQLPPGILESLAHSNFRAPRPRPIDPAVFYDLVKIRSAVDEATNLAVRAASGLTSAALSSQPNAANGVLGLGYVAGGQNTKLSRERKYRMRELATQKLSHAYHLDEIAASVAIMQSASALDDVAHFVLQRSAAHPDAKYVHFFHEKIPSRMMAEYTPLDPLDHVVSERPNDGSALRTRALTRLFKEDYVGAVRDLTDGLSIARYMQQQHKVGKDQLVLARTAREDADACRATPREWRDSPVKEEDQPSSLEMQLLFHRAGAYFSLAYQHVSDALDGLKDFEARRKEQMDGLDPGAEQPSPSPEEKEAHRKRLENRKLVKTYAKRALRDYIAFLSHFEYTRGINAAVAEDFHHHKANDIANGVKGSELSYRKRAQELTDSDIELNAQASSALIQRQREIELNSHGDGTPSSPLPAIHPLSALFSSTPPPDLPPYPPPAPAPHATTHPLGPADPAATRTRAFVDEPSSHAERQEAVTYHPLLTDALHSLLLCHALAQTPPAELRRHAHNVARLARLCDGYPVFLPARSPARADWTDVLRRAGADWLGLAHSWDRLCRPAPLASGRSCNSSDASNGSGGSGGSSSSTTSTTSELARTTAPAASVTRKTDPARLSQEGHGNGSGGNSSERKKYVAIMEALADERVVDDDSFQRSVRAREQQQEQCNGDEEGRASINKNVTSSSSSLSPPPTFSQKEQPKRWAQDDDGKGYLLAAERAEVIARWVREAPRSGGGGGAGAGKGGGGKKRRGKKSGAAAAAERKDQGGPVAELEGGVESLGLGY
ncbi:histidine kinase group protein [Diplodia corticola]|uniref:Histidine kinase group protein n=1 Tax=Diplodia corticola TaxID=236234 RepID=A0A1J9R7B6_9PEZI|nr:histidine kinase group protein [Diplodia corticola]OJD36480.1 histidine kinase group protein [Diplodia corticola]